MQDLQHRGWRTAMGLGFKVQGLGFEFWSSNVQSGDTYLTVAIECMLCPSYAGPAAQELEDSSALDVPKACSGNGGMPQSDALDNLLQKLETSQQGNRLVGLCFPYLHKTG